MDTQARKIISPTQLAYDLGWSSAKSELPSSSNPYQPINDQHDDWLAGWQSFHQVNEMA